MHIKCREAIHSCETHRKPRSGAAVGKNISHVCLFPETGLIHSADIKIV